MATGDGVTEWIDVADFTPGIHSGTRSFATGTPESATDGVAQVRDTWGCVANPTGGLEPAPEHPTAALSALGSAGARVWAWSIEDAWELVRPGDAGADAPLFTYSRATSGRK